MSEPEKTIPTPGPGYCVIKRVAKDKTDGGVVIPISAQEANDQAYMVASSGSYISNGQSVRHECPPGARLLIAPKATMTSFASMPDGHYLLQLHAVIGWQVVDKESLQ